MRIQGHAQHKREESQSKKEIRKLFRLNDMRSLDYFYTSVCVYVRAYNLIIKTRRIEKNIEKD